ncbi:TIGR02679 family protein [Catenulispora sp. MAP5-51]|uniref:TIGR02679 family protein n=1 Tax=Catenulispora sp. MAP5-51 TaxID=3156298 RepID=UPI0035135AE7
MIEHRSDAAEVKLTVADLSQPERDVLRWLLRIAEFPTDTLKVRIRRLDAALTERTDARMATRALLEALDGRLDDHRGERRRTRSDADELWQRITLRAAVLDEPRLLPFLDAERSRGALPADIEAREQLLTDTIDVLAYLPVTDRTPLTVLAATAVGAAHALDPGPLQSLVLRALAHLAGRPPAVGGLQERDLWASVGVTPDELSSRVLLHGFRPTGDSPLAAILRISADAGTPHVLTFQQLDRHLRDSKQPILADGARAWICENVAVMSVAADRLGSACPPLICIEGWPSTAAARLIGHLIQCGVKIEYHGDFDKAGIEITNRITTMGGRPWRMSAADYRTFTSAGRRLPSLDPRQIPDTTWDGQLADELRATGLQLEEEHVVDELIADLATAIALPPS